MWAMMRAERAWQILTPAPCPCSFCCSSLTATARSFAMSQSVDSSERTLLLVKARTAFDKRMDDKARRILQRLAARTMQDEAPVMSAADGTAAAPRDAFALPIVAPVPAVERCPVGDGLQLPAMAPALHSALSAAAAPPSVSLPTADHPPLFLVYNNMGLLHLRAGKFVLSNVFFARAVSTRALTHVRPLIQSGRRHCALWPESSLMVLLCCRICYPRPGAAGAR